MNPSTNPSTSDRGSTAHKPRPSSPASGSDGDPRTTTRPTDDAAGEDPMSTAAQALAAAGDEAQARDVGALDAAAGAAQRKLGRGKRSLVERLIYGPPPPNEELRSGARGLAGASDSAAARQLVDAAIGCMRDGRAFTADGALSKALRAEVATAKGYGFTVAADFGGADGGYTELAVAEEELAANGLGALAVEISGELTIGAGSLLAYGTDTQQRTFLPLLAEGTLMGFALSEVGVGVNAKKVQAYVELDEDNDCWRLFADGPRNKLWITNAHHGGLLGLVARIGKGGKKVGLFVLRMPEADVTEKDGKDHTFSLVSSDVAAFGANFNSRLAFHNFPIPRQNRIEADGVEVLFYCLRMGRCMLAAMSAGYQRMFAADAAQYARTREGVGGKVIRHDLPRLGLAKMLGGALQARALSHLSLQQDADGVDLAGLRDLTKSAAAGTALESLVACERVLGGRSFDAKARITEARPNMHVFGVVEGEDDLILMGMVKDITTRFTDDHLAGMLGVIQSINVDQDGDPLPRERRILRIGPAEMIREPGRCLTATLRLLRQKGFWKLKLWIVRNLLGDLLRLPRKLMPTDMLGRYDTLPPELRRHARFAEDNLRRLRWTWLGINLWFQLELTRMQLPLQRFGKAIEHLVSMLALCHHAAKQDQSQQRVAAAQCELLRDKFLGLRLLRGLTAMGRLRAHLEGIADDIERDRSSLIADIEPQPFAHDWREDGQQAD
jgi:alkylation response protein AidB-like acyl-CoA dehydrogenase